jgi:hypothetical protein
MMNPRYDGNAFRILLLWNVTSYILMWKYIFTENPAPSTFTRNICDLYI